MVLYFFPAAFTAGCTAEAHAFAEATDDFKKQGATVIGVTAGNIDRVAEFSKLECRGKFAVAADPEAKIAKQYDSVFAAKPELSDRTSYVIAPNGKIAFVRSDLNPSDHVKTTMAAVVALKGKKGLMTVLRPSRAELERPERGALRKGAPLFPCAVLREGGEHLLPEGREGVACSCCFTPLGQDA